jgi:hypothetical protein
MKCVPEVSRSQSITGLNLVSATFGEELFARGGSHTMLVFLRHYGCMFNREMMRDIRWTLGKHVDFPTPLFVGLGDEDETRDFLKPVWPEARVICDPDRKLYDAFELGRGSAMQMFGPSVWACHIRASFKGNFFGKFVGDPWIMPGLFVVDRSHAIRFTHTFRHQGDHPDWAKIPGKLGLATAMPLTPNALLV